METTGILDADLQSRINNSKILVVGAGGIGCELLKNLVLTGFKDIEVVSNQYSAFIMLNIIQSKGPI